MVTVDCDQSREVKVILLSWPRPQAPTVDSLPPWAGQQGDSRRRRRWWRWQKQQQHRRRRRLARLPAWVPGSQPLLWSRACRAEPTRNSVPMSTVSVDWRDDPQAAGLQLEAWNLTEGACIVLWRLTRTGQPNPNTGPRSWSDLPQQRMTVTACMPAADGGLPEQDPKTLVQHLYIENAEISSVRVKSQSVFD